MCVSFLTLRTVVHSRGPEFGKACSLNWAWVFTGKCRLLQMRGSLATGTEKEQGGLCMIAGSVLGVLAAQSLGQACRGEASSLVQR